MQNGSKPICVDLDGTLIKSDTLLEGCLALAKTNALQLFLALAGLVRGRAYFKKTIARVTSVDAGSLPYHAEFVNFLASEHAAGRPIVLATGADEKLASTVASHLGFFSRVIASNGVTNLSGRQKGLALEQLFGRGGFIYAGNSAVDIPVWQSAGDAIAVNASASVLSTLRRKRIGIWRRFQEERRPLAILARALRIHQWLKNLLLFIPFIFAHKKPGASDLVQMGAAFLAFSLCASAAYVLNDLLDLEADRSHPLKRYRPLASGELSLLAGLCLIPLLLCGSWIATLWVPAQFALVLGIYLLATILYSSYFKRLAVLDVTVLAGLYTIRIMAGGAAAQVRISPWMLGFSMFLFLSLALVKRFSELHRLRLDNGDRSKGRGYRAGDLELLASLGASSGYLAVLVAALYLNSPEVRVLYRNPTWLWALCPLLIYWISRIWLLGHRGEMLEDAIVFALQDKTSYLVGGLAAAAFVLAL